MEIRNKATEFEVNMPLTVFKEGDLEVVVDSALMLSNSQQMLI